MKAFILVCSIVLFGAIVVSMVGDLVGACQ